MPPSPPPSAVRAVALDPSQLAKTLPRQKSGSREFEDLGKARRWDFGSIEGSTSGLANKRSSREFEDVDLRATLRQHQPVSSAAILKAAASGRVPREEVLTRRRPPPPLPRMLSPERAGADDAADLASGGSSRADKVKQRLKEEHDKVRDAVREKAGRLLNRTRSFAPPRKSTAGFIDESAVPDPDVVLLADLVLSKRPTSPVQATQRAAAEDKGAGVAPTSFLRIGRSMREGNAQCRDASSGSASPRGTSPSAEEQRRLHLAGLRDGSEPSVHGVS